MHVTRRRALAVPVCALALVAASGPREAGADALTFEATHKIRFSFNGGIEEVSATGTGVAIVNGGTVGGPLQTLELLEPFAEIDETVFGSSQTGLDSVRFQDVQLFRRAAPFAGPLGNPGVFAPIATAAQNTAVPLVQNTLPVAGTITLCKSFGCANPIPVSLSQTDAGEAVGVGVGGSFSESYPTPPPVILSIEGHPWTIHGTQVTYATTTPSMMGTAMLTEAGFAHGPTMSPSSTAVPGGVVQLVSGVQVTALGLNGNNQAGQVGILTIQFTPEPGWLALFGSGAVAMAALGRQRIRRARRPGAARQRIHRA